MGSWLHRGYGLVEHSFEHRALASSTQYRTALALAWPAISSLRGSRHLDGRSKTPLLCQFLKRHLALDCRYTFIQNSVLSRWRFVLSPLPGTGSAIFRQLPARANFTLTSGCHPPDHQRQSALNTRQIHGGNFSFCKLKCGFGADPSGLSEAAFRFADAICELNMAPLTRPADFTRQNHQDVARAIYGALEPDRLTMVGMADRLAKVGPGFE